MKSLFRIIISELNVDSLAAITFQIAKIQLLPKYTQCWEQELFSAPKLAKSPIHFTWWTLPISRLKTAPIPNIGHIQRRSRFLQFGM